VIPSTRANGQPLLLSELAGYEIYYVLENSNAADTKIVVNGGGSTSYTINGMAAGTYDFAISAVDTAGLKSSLSGVVVVHIGP
jgi:L-2-hydroxyglutarate oxidase LhgO